MTGEWPARNFTGEMMRYAYKIAGRSHYVLDQTEYAGTVMADTPKLALVEALAASFGHEAEEDDTAIDRLTKAGWIDRDTLMDVIDQVADDDTDLTLECDDNTFAAQFAVQVEEVQVEEVSADDAVNHQFTVSVHITTNNGNDINEDFMVDAGVNFTIPGGITDDELTRLVKVLAGGVRDQVLANVWPRQISLA